MSLFNDLVITIGPYKIGEIPPTLEYQFLKSDGTAMDISGFNAVFKYQGDGDAIEQPAMVSDGATGKVEYAWTGDEFNAVGFYQAEFWIANVGETQVFASMTIQWQVSAGLGRPTF